MSIQFSAGQLADITLVGDGTSASFSTDLTDSPIELKTLGNKPVGVINGGVSGTRRGSDGNTYTVVFDVNVTTLTATVSPTLPAGVSIDLGALQLLWK